MPFSGVGRVSLNGDRTGAVTVSMGHAPRINSSPLAQRFPSAYSGTPATREIGTNFARFRTHLILSKKRHRRNVHADRSSEKSIVGIASALIAASICLAPDTHERTHPELHGLNYMERIRCYLDRALLQIRFCPGRA